MKSIAEHDAEDTDDIQQQHPLGVVAALQFCFRPELRQLCALLRRFHRYSARFRKESRGLDQKNCC